ncbi:MAG: alcohol dehydrogenase [Chloroflexi bacterium HGW-Chloroflexi-4]|jgi:NADPH:quinone reductase-like Zn-dependent oxidoreductase|nr:MAG: alcohol dehydrogenase [Chloroflexi bacterium HGW-Chloroflexi-4]
MKAVVYDKSNKPDVLVHREVEKPLPIADQVLIKIMAVSVNAADYRSLRYGIIPKTNIYGADVAGTIEAVGPEVKHFKIGDEVFGDILKWGSGGFAEYVAVSEEALAFKPASVSFESTATVSMAGITALQGLRDLGRIQPGQKVLIIGAGGGVGNFAVQLAKYYGAHVTGICGPQNVEIVKSLGADRVIDYTENNFTEEKFKYDLILAVHGSYRLTQFRRALTPNGIMVMAGGALLQLFRQMAFGGLFSMGGQKMQLLKAEPNRKDLVFLIKLVEEGKLKTVIDRTYPLAETAEAMKYANHGHTLGKVVIRVNE